MAEDLLERLNADLPLGAGPIGLLSGDEFRAHATALDRALMALAGPRVALILCADHRHAVTSAGYARRHFEPLGAELHIVDPAHDARPAADLLPQADVVYVAGGSPAELLGCLRGSALWEEAIRRWRAGTVALVGSSAGAMAMCSHCLEPRPGEFVPTVWSQGLGPLRDVALAVHASSRTREWLHEVAAAAPVPMLAIPDETGVILRPRRRPLTIGRSPCWRI